MVRTGAQLALMVERAAGIIAGSGKSVGICLAMGLVGFSDEEKNECASINK